MRYYNLISRKTFEAPSDEFITHADLPYPLWPKQGESATKSLMLTIARYRLAVHRADAATRRTEYEHKMAAWRENALSKVHERAEDIVALLESKRTLFTVSYAGFDHDAKTGPLADLFPPEPWFESTHDHDIALVTILELMPDGELTTAQREALRVLGASYD